MKKPIFLTLTLCVGMLIGCDKTEVDSAKVSEQLKAVPGTFADQTSNFAFAFWKQHNAIEDKSKNHFVSPLSLHVALGMLLNGADTKTKDEIQKVLGVSSNITEANKIYKDLMESLPNADPKVVNTIANSVWHDKAFKVEQAYLNDLQNYFKAKVSAEDFANPATVNKINQWASDNTNAKIQKVLEKIEPSHVMFLLNALYFKGDWKVPFDPQNTRDEEFLNLSGRPKNVKMMSMTNNVKYASRNGYHAIELPYGSGNYTMTIMMPQQSVSSLSPDAIIDKLTLNEWKELNKAMTEQKIIIGLPKFTIEYETNLNNALQKMGMPTAFSNQADLSKISPPAGKVKVGFVKQNTYVSVDEKGTEAAAVTTIGIELTSVQIRPEFICNRPFVFVISEKQSNTVLFAGKVVNL
ncbi:MAG: serpin family protein [Spirosomataceae bacterium]